MFSSKTDFINGLNDGRVKNLTLVEYVGPSDELVTAERKRTVGKKPTVMAVTANMLFFKNTANETIQLEVEGKWTFKGHSLKITTNTSEAVFIVNPLF